ncbi:UNVERIFIED_ORG: hypothetical protein LHJ69_10200 [Shinella sp. XGS7]|nr:hypothetical protein [Shinella sp. XGS7]
MNIRLPIRLIAGSLCFLYLVLPIVFVPSVREVLGLTPIAAGDYFIGAFYSLLTFLIVLQAPRDVVIRPGELRLHESVARAIAWLSILGSAYFFANALLSLDTLIYFDKVVAHMAYEEINLEHRLRLKYNMLLCVFLLSSIKARMKGWGTLFFLAPVLFEVVFSKHNYATHLLTYLFLLTWNSSVSRRTVVTVFTLAVLTLLGLRFAFYSDFQNSAMQSLAAMLGEFTISWQSIPSALTFHGSTFTSPNEWYSDVISSAAGLEIGLAGNPVAEAVFYFGDWAGPMIVASALGFVVVAHGSRQSLTGGIALMVTAYYLRDCFRTGWSLGASVYLKSLVIFLTATLFVNGTRWLATTMSERASKSEAST